MTTAETHIATCVAIEDPEKRGRIKVACAGILGDEEQALPMWVEPMYAWGWFIVPDVGEMVDVHFTVSDPEDESESQTSISNPNLRWSGRHWGGADTEHSRPIPSNFTGKNYGKRRGFATPGGHVLVFDDTDGQKEVTLSWKGKDGEQSFISMNEDGSVVISNKKGSSFNLNAKDGEVSIIDQFGNNISTAETGIKLVDKNSNIIELKDGALSILCDGTVNITSQDAVIDAGKIALGGAAAVHPGVLGDLFMALFSAHTHPTGVGPSGPPIPQGTESAVLSTVVNLK